MLEYADDRPWPGSTGWSDAASRNALDVIANGVEHMTGFAASCINVVHRGTLRTVAMGAPAEQRELLMDSHTPVDVMESELTHATDWGRFKFLPAVEGTAERITGVVFDYEPLEGHDAWHPDNVLAAPIRDELGRMVGMLAVDLPVTGREPDAATRERLDRYAELVEGAVLMALERDEQQERIRMARAARDVVAAATQNLAIGAIFAASAQALMAGFGARGAWLQTFDLGEPHAVHGEGGVVSTVPRSVMDAAERMARVAWGKQAIIVLAHDRPTPTTHSLQYDADCAAVLTYLATIGVGSILFVSIGVGAECLGCLVLSRGPRAQRWSTVESEAARDIGMDLGRAILNARAFSREQRAVQELQALDAYKSQLIATLSHELKTPLTSILGNIELLDGADPSSDDAHRGIGAIGRGASRLVRVVDDLLLLAKVGDPGFQLISRPVDLVKLVEEVVELTAPTARQRRITVTLRARGPVHALGDAAELDRVVANLLTNALKYTPEGGRILVEVSMDDSVVSGDAGAEVADGSAGHPGDAGHAVFSCTDSGIGISADDQTRLFHEFFRSRDPAAQNQPGTGLGLTIVDRIVRRHHGRVEVESTPGAGSVFRVRVPGVVAVPAGLAQPTGVVR